ncbi:MAG: replication-associated recombination protein A [Puniceicoccales bacterium]|nr:replication-associated recombination protein A [Puniceicoccales bacterium]
MLSAVKLCQVDLFAAGAVPSSGAPSSARAAPPGGAAHGQAVPAPLAVRLRPRRLAEVVGQPHILGEGCLLPRLIRQNSFGNIILCGPPGCGKTSLAEAIAAEIKSHFIRLNAVLSNLAELRTVLQGARAREEPPILFIDEIHRFNRSQQDALLPDVERGTIRLIGATTHTPGIYVIAPLLSRCHLFQLEPLSEETVVDFLRRALVDRERGLGNLRCTVEDAVFFALSRTCDGDLRRALNNLETLVSAVPRGGHVGWERWECFGKERNIRYDRDEGEHHATISAYIKSMRGCDPDAALYWLAKMLAGGEDPRFIARRLVIFASEDVGLADPHALPIANACFDACERVGLPECAINLGHATTFMATAPKSNSAYLALCQASEEIAKHPVQPVPPYLRNQPRAMARKLGTEDYHYAHNFTDNVADQRYMLEPKRFYFPKKSGAETLIADRLARIRPGQFGP